MAVAKRKINQGIKEKLCYGALDIEQEVVTTTCTSNSSLREELCTSSSRKKYALYNDGGSHPGWKGDLLVFIKWPNCSILKLDVVIHWDLCGSIVFTLG